MSNVSPLDSVIRRIKNPQEISQNEECVIINDKDGTVYSKDPGFFDSIGKRIHYYAVSNVNHANCAGFHFTLNNALGLDINYTVSCPNNNEVRAVQSLYTGSENLESCLNGILKKGVATFYKDNTTENAITNRRKLELYLAEYGNSQTGLSFNTVVKFKNEDRLVNFSINTSPFKVRTADYEDALYIKVETDLVVSQDKWELALENYYRIPEIENKIKKCVENYLIANISLTDFCLDLTGKVKTRLFNEINNLVEKEGRHIEFLKLSSSSINTLVPEQNPIKITLEEPYEIKEYEKKVQVKSKLKLHLTDVGLFRSKRIIDLKNWFSENVIKEVIADELFGHNYKKILLSEKKIKKTIEKKIQSEAKKIGYDVEQHTFLPQLNQLNVVRDGFSIDFEDDFQTKDNRVSIKLQIILKGKTGKLKELDDRFLLPDVSLKKEIEKKIREIAEHKIHQIPPENIFMGFDFPTDNTTESPSEIIKNAIAIELRKHFKVEPATLSTLIKLSENKITKKAETLAKGIYTFNLNIIPSAEDIRTEPLECIIRFRVLGVRKKGWATFQARINRTAEEDIKEMKGILIDYVRRDLQALSHSTLINTSFEYQNKIRETIENHAFSEAGQQFGLRLHCASPPKIKSNALEEAAETTIQNNRLREENARSLQKDLLIAESKEMEALLNARLEAAKDIHELDADEIDEKITKKLENNILHKSDSQTTKKLLKGTSSGSSSFEQFDLTKKFLSENNSEDNNQEKIDNNDNV